MHPLVYPINALDWLWLGIAMLADVSAQAASADWHRDAPAYRGPQAVGG